MSAGALSALGCWMLAGALVGGLFVPWAADLLLQRVRKRESSWWWDSLRAYQGFKRSRPRGEPSARARGEEGALGIWLGEALRSARAGELSEQRAAALAEAACLPKGALTLVSEAAQDQLYRFAARRWQRAACALGCALAAGLLGACAAPPLPATACALSGVAMAVATACDLRARVVPLESCAALALCGALLQASVAGPEGLVSGLLFAAVVALGCLALGRVWRGGGAAPVGGGDARCMMALSLASGAAAPLGFVVCYAGAAAFSLGGVALRRLRFQDGIPMAPFLSAWLVAGAWAGLCQ